MCIPREKWWLVPKDTLKGSELCDGFVQPVLDIFHTFSSIAGLHQRGELKSRIAHRVLNVCGLF